MHGIPQVAGLGIGFPHRFFDMSKNAEWWTHFESFKKQGTEELNELSSFSV
jgi:LPS sulfotransferase NodH